MQPPVPLPATTSHPPGTPGSVSPLRQRSQPLAQQMSPPSNGYRCAARQQIHPSATRVALQPNQATSHVLQSMSSQVSQSMTTGGHERANGYTEGMADGHTDGRADGHPEGRADGRALQVGARCAPEETVARGAMVSQSVTSMNDTNHKMGDSINRNAFPISSISLSGIITYLTTCLSLLLCYPPDMIK